MTDHNELTSHSVLSVVIIACAYWCSKTNKIVVFKWVEYFYKDFVRWYAT